MLLTEMTINDRERAIAAAFNIIESKGQGSVEFTLSIPGKFLCDSNFIDIEARGVQRWECVRALFNDLAEVADMKGHYALSQDGNHHEAAPLAVIFDWGQMVFALRRGPSP